MVNEDKYRVARGSHRANDGTRYGRGDVFVPSDRELEAFPDKFERVEEQTEAPDSDIGIEATNDENEGEDEVPPGRGDPFNPGPILDQHWSKVQSDIEEGHHDAHLDELESAENERNSPRSSIIRAIEERR